MHNRNFSTFWLTALVCSSHVWGAPPQTVSNSDIEGAGGLRAALDTINAAPAGPNEIDFTVNMLNMQTHNLPPIEIGTNTLLINGPTGGISLDGGNTFRGFFVSSGNVTIQNMVLTNAIGKGGNGGTGVTGGGGGLGAGSALFVKSGATVTLNTVSITSNTATGGSGGAADRTNHAAAGGGGGMGGNGGNGGGNNTTSSGGGGGGLFGSGAAGDIQGGGAGGGGLFGNGGIPGGGTYASNNGGGGGGGVPIAGSDGQAGMSGPAMGGNGGHASMVNGGRGANNSGNGSLSGEAGGINTGGGGGLGVTSGGRGGDGGTHGGGGGGGASLIPGTSGGNGGMYGGGGSAGASTSAGSGVLGFAGTGGFGGGGAGGTLYFSTTMPHPGGAVGGFGGGAGGSVFHAGVNGGYGGGGSGADSSLLGGQGGAFAGNGGDSLVGYGGGGGGAGLGGAIFIHEGGTVIIQDGVLLSGNSVVGGAGGAGDMGGSAGGAGQALGSDIFMMSTAELTFDLSGDLSILTDIVGDNGAGGGSLCTNGVTKMGLGTLTLGGTNTYSGFTTVSAGTLVINGSTTTSTLVENGGTLKGIGTINNTVTVKNGGIIAPGNSIGTIHTGSLVLYPESKTVIAANNSGASSLIEITGDAALNGTLHVDFDAGSYTEGQLFTILTATGSVSGVFSATEANPSGMLFHAIYHPNSVQIRLGASSGSTLSLVGISGNAKTVGNYINSIASQPFIQPALTALSLLTTEQLSDALKSISPGRNSFSTYVSQDTMFTVNKVATTRMSIQRSLRSIGQQKPMMAALMQESLNGGEALLADADDSLEGMIGLFKRSYNKPRGSTTKAAAGKDEYAVWASGLGDFTHQDKQQQNPSFDATAGGGLLGFETYQFSNLLLGAAAGYARSTIDMDHKAGNTDINSYFVGLYETTYICDGYIEFCLWGTFNQFKIKRHIVYPGFDATARSSHTGWQLTPSVSCGYDFAFSWGVIEPFAELDTVINVEQRFSEKGAFPYNMRQSSNTSEFLRFETGVNSYESWSDDWGSLILRETVSYVLRKPFHVGTVNASIIGAPGAFTVYSFTKTQHVLSPGAEVFYKHKSGAFTSLTYSGEFGFGSGFMSNEVIGKLGVYF